MPVGLVAFSANGEKCLTGSYDETACVWKRVYDFSCLTEEKKEKNFKHFITLYPLVQGIINPTSSNGVPSTVSSSKDVPNL